MKEVYIVKNAIAREVDYGKDRDFSTNVSNTGRVERVIKLIALMQRYRSVKECARELQIQERSVYPYHRLLAKLGFRIKVKSSGGIRKYRIINTIHVLKIF